MSSCKTTNVELLPIVEYEITIIEQEQPKEIEYEVTLLDITKYSIEITTEINGIEYKIKPEHTTEVSQNTFKFLYCVSYRDPSLPEWILAR
jgi:hypothetical protein